MSSRPSLYVVAEIPLNEKPIQEFFDYIDGEGDYGVVWWEDLNYECFGEEADKENMLYIYSCIQNDWGRIDLSDTDKEIAKIRGYVEGLFKHLPAGIQIFFSLSYN